MNGCSDNDSTGSDQAFQLVRTWLRQCINGHSKCQGPTAEDSYLPRRVIDIGPEDSTPEPSLLETFNQPGRYITLSHCWGGGSHIMTTTENVEQHKTSIPYKDLPKTFRESIDVTRKLGHRYLWIDSLCIIQNDKSDWETEGAMMHQYYKNSSLTIAAADADNSAAGLFRARNGLDYRPCMLPLHTPGSRPRKLYAFTNRMSSDIKRSSLSNSFHSSRLYSRAWVFQEQVLSRRTLSYAKDRMTLRCQEMVFEERVPFMQPVESFLKEKPNMITRNGDSRTTDAAIMRLQREAIFATPSATGFQDHGCSASPATKCFSDRDGFLVRWGNIVTEYTERNLTYQSDKLLAVQGIADAMAPILSQPYFAGSWIGTTRSIVLSLLWHSQELKGRPCTRVDIAPSWSWPSVSHRVVWLPLSHHQLEPVISIIDLKRNGTATTCSGELFLSGNATKVVMQQNQLLPLSDSDGTTLSNNASSKNDPIFKLDEDVTDMTPLLILEVAKGFIHAHTNQKKMHCLILTKSSIDSSAYRRVGYSMCDEGHWNVNHSGNQREMLLKIV
jgi:hypothetical protein